MVNSPTGTPAELHRRPVAPLIESADTTLFGKILLMGGTGGAAVDARHPALGLFVSLSGGRRARIVILSQSSKPGVGDHQTLAINLRNLGAKRVDIIDLPVHPTDHIFSGSATPHATGFLFAGDDPKEMLASLASSVLLSAIRSRHQHRAAIAGIRAGAAILGSAVVGDGAMPAHFAGVHPVSRKGDVTLLPGLGFLPDWIIDPYFGSTRSLDPLLGSIAANPALLGLGIEEGVGIVANPQGQVTSLGGGMALGLDGRGAVSDYTERRWGEVVSISGPRLFVLGESKRFDPHMREMQSILPGD